MKYFIACICLFFIANAGYAQLKCMTGDCENGYGTAMLKEDNGKYFYAGYFKNGLFDGFGELETNTRDGNVIYKGNFKKGKFNGTGTHSQESASNICKYNGQFKNGEFNGKGTYEIQDKKTKTYEVREGIFVDGQISGLSKVFTAKFTYVGNLENGVRDGLGMIQYKDGTCYRGYFKNNKYDDIGQINSDGSFNCAGQVIDGKCCTGINLSLLENGDCFIGMSGDSTFGLQTYSDSVGYYIGFLENNKKKGAGVMWTNGTATFQSWNKVNPEYPDKYFFTLNDTNCVTGDCNKGLNVMIYDSQVLTCNFDSLKPYGFAVIQYLDGKTLYGMVDSSANIKDGFTIMENGLYTYIGYRYDKEFCGRGIILENKSQIVYVGQMQFMKPNGQGLLIDRNNQILNIGLFENGKFVGNEPIVPEEPEVMKFNIEESSTDEEDDSD